MAAPTSRRRKSISPGSSSVIVAWNVRAALRTAGPNATLPASVVLADSTSGRTAISWRGGLQHLNGDGLAHLAGDRRVPSHRVHVGGEPVAVNDVSVDQPGQNSQHE